MAWSYIARQPILDASRRIFGFELLFRDGENNAFPDVSDEEATSRLIVEQQFDRDIRGLVGKHLAFINFSRKSLLDDHPKLLPPEKVVIEVLEHVLPDAEVIAVCQNLKKLGYTLALDDHDFNKDWHRWIHLFDIIKVDISQFSRRQLTDHLADSDLASVRLLAERVETEEDFVYCQQLGFSLFQGYFFAKPQMVRKQTLATNRLSTLQMLALVSKSEIDFIELEQAISRDPGLSFKLLRFLNSVYFGLGSRIPNVKQALVYLGQNEIKKFIALVSMSTLGGSEQSAAISLAATRAHFCESLAGRIEGCDIQGSAFLIGLFSMIDTLMEDSMENILKLLPVDDSIREALLEQRGIGADLLQLANHFELANWEEISQYSKRLGIDEEQLSDCYEEAARIALEFVSETGA